MWHFYSIKAFGPIPYSVDGCHNTTHLIRDAFISRDKCENIFPYFLYCIELMAIGEKWKIANACHCNTHTELEWPHKTLWTDATRYNPFVFGLPCEYMLNCMTSDHIYVIAIHTSAIERYSWSLFHPISLIRCDTNALVVSQVACYVSGSWFYDV